MDSMAQIESEVKLGVKRVAEDVGGGPSLKKMKTGGLGVGVGVLGNVKKVAEMVLLLAAIGKMRGGRVPSQVEKDVVSAAREKLAEVCQCFPPKDVFPRDVFGAIIEDLGLDRIKDQRLHFRSPKVTIADKFLLSKQKMEKSEDLSVPPASGSLRFPTNSGVAVGTRASPHAVRVLPSDKYNHMPVVSGSFQTASPFSHATNSASLPYQLPTSEVRPGISSGLPSNHLGRDPASVSIPRTDRLHFSVDRRSNGPSNVSHLQATNSGDHRSIKTATWSMQPQPVPLTKVSTDAKVQLQTLIKLEGAADVKTGNVPPVSTSKPIIMQSTSGSVQNQYQHSQVRNTVQAPILGNTHAEIGNIVQKVLQSESSDLPVWIPPSRDYMNQALFCQVCKSNINDVDSVLVCDACEKGFHLKCLQINNAKGIPKGDWHCSNCLQLSQGKTLPPKYGRVMRNISAPKVPTTTSSTTLSSNKKAGSPDEKINQQKTLPNGNIAQQIVPCVSMVTNFGDPASASKGENPSGVRENCIVAKGKRGDESSSELNSNNTSAAPGLNMVSPFMPSVKGVHEQKLELNPLPVSMSEIANSLSDNSQSWASTEDNDKTGLVHDVPPKQPYENHIIERTLNDSCRAESSCDKETQESSDERGTEQANSAVTSTTADRSTGLERPVSDAVSSVDWVGDTLRVDDSKLFYHSCSISGVVYKLQDHVLIRFSDNRVIPSKLQSMWEDSLTKSKWVTVTRYYFPDDLPEAVGRPCSLESNEVYESTYGCTAIADMIQGLCEVLPPSKFAVEKERRNNLGMGSKDILRPLYLCKWIYDESKGLFRDVSC